VILSNITKVLGAKARDSFTPITAQRLQRLVSRGLVFALVALTAHTQAGTREQALQIHKRVAGVPPSEAVLLQMAAFLESGQKAKAVQLAMDNENFYSVILKNMATPWTNREQTVFAPLNDYTATVIGLVRDDQDFRKILFDDILYIGAPGQGLPAYSNSNNNHYQALQDQAIELRDKSKFVSVAQSSVNGLPPAATAGVITSRAAAKAFFIAGTNRAMFRFTLMNHMCRDLEQVHDTTRTPDFIRQDVSRSPGGDSRVFLNGCIGCHSGMDPLVKAFAYYDFEVADGADPDTGSIHYNGDGTVDPATDSRVEKKYRINSTTFPYGYVTTNDDWQNYWREGINANLGWSSELPGKGSGAKSMGMELAYSQAFASCQVEKVFKQVCLRKPANQADRNQLVTMTNNFAASGYHLKQVFIDSADYCKGE
jgi:hypothetical protein